VDQLFVKFDRPDSPGCSVGISKSGRVEYERGYGMANLELGTPITPASVFHVASISKQFTAMSIMLLAQRRQLSIDDEVRKYIKEFPDYGKRITIRHLLTHTSGLRDAYSLRELSEPRDEGTDRMDALVQILSRQRGLNFNPGAEYQYNNGGYTVLAVIVKRVSGQSLREFAEENIFKPLGMNHTHFHDDPEMVMSNRATGYHGDGAAVRIPVHGDLGRIVGNTGLFTTARDLLTWEQNFAYIRVGDPAMLKAMQTPTPLTGGGISPYGLGLQMHEYRGLRAVEHSGGDPGYAANLVRFPDQGIAIALLCNRDDIDLTGLTNGLADIYLAGSFPPSSQSTSTTVLDPHAVGVSADQLAMKVGLYRDTTSGNVGQISLRDGKLMANAGGDNMELIPVSADRFVIAGTPITLEFTNEEVHVTGAGPEPVVSRKVDTLKLSNVDMREFAGEYRNIDLGVKYALTATEAGLVIQRPSRPKIPLQPTAPDEFFGDIVEVVKFSRDKRGTVTGFTIRSAGVRHLEFDRVKP
jgi:CubicO group peptidase (beta-lactamase class C family)